MFNKNFRREIYSLQIIKEMQEILNQKTNSLFDVFYPSFRLYLHVLSLHSNSELLTSFSPHKLSIFLQRSSIYSSMTSLSIKGLFLLNASNLFKSCFFLGNTSQYYFSYVTLQVHFIFFLQQIFNFVLWWHPQKL